MESDVLRWLAEREDALVALTRELVATPSPNPPGDERAVVEVARQAMEQLGFRDVRTIARAVERPNLVGEVGNGGHSLILNAHLDTKPAGTREEWETPPYDPVIRDGRLYGLGSTDMKGAAAAMLYAGAALAAAGALAGTLKVVLVADEEAGSNEGALHLARTRAVEGDAALVGEPTGITTGWEYLAVASRGLSCFRLVASGTQMHSSLSDRLPSSNASVKLARGLVRFADAFRLPVGATLNLGVTLGGGIFYGVYPGQAECGIDVRTVPGMTLEALRADVLGFVERERLDLDVQWVPELEWLPPSAIDPQHPLVAAARSAARQVLGREVPLGTMPAVTDGTNWSEAGIPSVPAFGPGLLPLAHRPNEYVEVREVVEAARIYALTALRFLSEAID
jgi:acetylornithine deacetylase/succinyl-diaminopimelate desuccinylase-like protein